MDKLVHITINGEEIITTDNYPFYVQGRGFIEAGSLLVGDKLISVNGEDLTIEDYYIKLTKEPVSVYNFQVEDFHTYFVGDCAVWVHNAKRCFSSSKEMHEATKNMSTEERVAVYKQEGRAAADGYGFKKDNKLTKVNSRDVYTDPKTKDLYALDTQHGTFEHCNKRGKHLEEVDFELNHIKDADKSGNHDLIVK